MLAVAGPAALSVTMRPATNLGCAAPRDPAPSRAPGPTEVVTRAVPESRRAGPSRPFRGILGLSAPRRARVAVSGGRTTLRPRSRMFGAPGRPRRPNSIVRSLLAIGGPRKRSGTGAATWWARARRQGRRPGSPIGPARARHPGDAGTGRFSRRATIGAARHLPVFASPGRASSCNAMIRVPGGA